jgi:hypothetical protein
VCVGGHFASPDGLEAVVIMVLTEICRNFVAVKYLANFQSNSTYRRPVLPCGVRRAVGGKDIFRRSEFRLLIGPRSSTLDSRWPMAAVLSERDGVKIVLLVENSFVGERDQK